jgi:hypothetical protein
VGVVVFVLASALLVDYLASHSPRGAAARSARINRDAIRAAREVYIASGCATVNGVPFPDPSYLPHHDCACGREDAIAPVATTVTAATEE